VVIQGSGALSNSGGALQYAFVLYWCGVRLGEAEQIEWSQVDLTMPCIRLEEDQTKNDQARIVPLPPVLIKILKAIEPKTGRVFDATNLRTECGKACEAVGLGKRVKQTSESGNIWYAYEGLIVHDLRRSAVRNLVNAEENVAMNISGHKTASVFRRYRIVSPADVVEAMQKVVANTLPPNKVAKRPGQGAKRFGDSLVTGEHKLSVSC